MKSGCRIFGLDVARAFAIVLIMSSHWCRSLGGGHLGNFFGVIGNSLFFCLSGIGLGLGWYASGKPQYDSRFLLKRTLKIFPAYWIVLIAGGIIYYDTCTVHGLLLNVVGLSWVAKLPFGGHLWFVTAILILYVLIVLITRVPWISHHKRMMVVAPLGMLGMALLPFGGCRQSWVLVYLVSALLLFVYANNVIGFLRVSRGVIIIVAMTFASLWGLSDHVTASSRAVLCSIGVLSACSVIGCLLRLPHDKSFVVSFVASVSYELYLVHTFFCYTIPLSQWLPNRLGYFVVYVILSLCTAWMLHCVVQYLQNLITRRLTKIGLL